MRTYNTVMDYLEEQADKYDQSNLQFEEDLIYRVNREQSNMAVDVVNLVNIDITNVMKMQSTMNMIQRRFDRFVSNIKKIYDGQFHRYYDIAYDQMGDLLELGMSMSDKMSANTRELKQYDMYGDSSIDYVAKHALETTSAYADDRVERIRSMMAEMMLTGKGSKANIRARIEKILDVNKSKAEEIAQTELSRAYNFGEMERINEYQKQTGQTVKKRWHGFKESKVTCPECREHIGEVYDMDDNTYTLPLHPRCRCIWLPVLDGWDKPVSTDITRRANMLKMVYSPDQVYNRINSRLGIAYGKYIDTDSAMDYLSGDRSERVMSMIDKARSDAISDEKQKIGIGPDTTATRWSNEFNDQLKFWKDIVAGAKVDNDYDLLDRSYEALKGVMLLPWNSSQLRKWNQLLGYIK